MGYGPNPHMSAPPYMPMMPAFYMPMGMPPHT